MSNGSRIREFPIRELPTREFPIREFPIRFPDQLRHHLRALRKTRGLTQTQLGALVGVSQARVAEIEANPGLVNFEQLMQLLTVLGISVVLHEDAPAKKPAGRPKASAKPRLVPTRAKAAGPPTPDAVARNTPRAAFVVRPRKGSW